MRAAVQGVLSLALVLALVLPFTAPAENGGEIRNYIISINHLYENLDYELALSRIQLARQLPRSTDDEVTLSLYQGIILYEMRKQGPATSVFLSALLLRPDAKLPVQVAPKVEALFESTRKQVKQEVASLLPPSGTEAPSTTAEQEWEDPPAPPSTAPTLEEHEDTKTAQSSKEEESSSVQPRTSETQVAKADTKLPSMSPPPSAQKAEQTKEGPVAVQPIKPLDCAPEPSLPGRNLKERQLSRLALMKQALCSNGTFQGLVSERWSELKTRIENAPTSHERMLITKDLDEFAREFLDKDPEREKRERLAAERREAERLAEEQWEAEQLEAEQREAEQLAAERREAEQREEERAQQKKKVRDAANLDTSKCQLIVSADCELLIQRILFTQEAFLRTKPASPLVPISQLVMLGQEIRAARTQEELQDAAHALDLWQQRQMFQ
ncbi:hypothetical protein ATI61_109186 [Archangium gephyra]|uniref:Uncharacterized protein n=1 Tax=Archangium gephyra TaxID=48 RepID=A0ABX9JVF2_9BACT|nr:hypothetical protein [Archangium gephyra]REG27847.1 hypothetical protein ATI61_109186 [Archangium gephyra]